MTWRIYRGWRLSLPAVALLLSVPVAASGPRAFLSTDQHQSRVPAVVQIGNRLSVPGAQEGGLTLRIAVADAPSKGSNGAAVVVVEFSDFDCAFCRRYARETFLLLDTQYVSSGKVKYVFKHFPLPNHHNAMSAHLAAECAAEQDKFWPMHAALFANGQARSQDVLTRLAQQAGVKVERFQVCMEQQRHIARIKRDVADGEMIINGTPAFFIGVAESPGSAVTVKRIITGAKSFRVFEEAIDGLLRPAGRAKR